MWVKYAIMQFVQLKLFHWILTRISNVIVILASQQVTEHIVEGPTDLYSEVPFMHFHLKG